MHPQDNQGRWFREQWEQMRGNIKWDALKTVLCGIFGGAAVQVIAWLQEQSPSFWGMVGTALLFAVAWVAVKLVTPRISPEVRRIILASGILGSICWFYFVSTLSSARPSAPAFNPSHSPSARKIDPNTIKFDSSTVTWGKEDITDFSLVTIIGTVSNRGPKTALSNWGMAVKGSDGSVIIGTPYFIRPGEKSVGDMVHGGLRQIFYGEESLYERTSVPIETGSLVSGFLMFTIDKEFLRKIGPGAQVAITFDDVFTATRHLAIIIIDRNLGNLRHPGLRSGSVFPGEKAK